MAKVCTELQQNMCNFPKSTSPQPSPSAPKSHPLFMNFALPPENASFIASSGPTLSPVLPCQAIFLPEFSQVTDSNPNRVSSPVRGLPPPICYPEYRVSSFQGQTIRSGWPTSARSSGECGNVASHDKCDFDLSNPCIFKFLPGNIGGRVVAG